MKRCPECRRDYYDDTLSFCLEDGVALVSGVPDEPATVVLAVQSSGGFADEPKTQSFERESTSGNRPSPVLNSHSAEQLDESTGRTFDKRLPLTALLIGIIALGGFASYRYLSSTGGGPIRSIAVLPFQNRSGDANADYLSDGVAESLIYRLSKLPNLQVSPTSSVIRYRTTEIDVPTVASDLGVEAVMTGKLVQLGESLTISVELVDARTNKLLWGEQYNRKTSELLATQREIANEIASKLQLKLSGEGESALAKRYTENNEAYQLYLKGRFHFAKRNRPDVQRSIEYFQQAIALDPNFALAYSALADSYNGMTAYPYMAPKLAIPLAKAAAIRAIEIDPTIAEPHTALANSLACFDWNWSEAEREFKRAIELNPNDAGTHWRYGMFYLMPLGRLEDAITEGKRSLELEPLDLNHGANLSGMYFYARRYDEALEQAEQVHGLDASFIVGRWALSQALIEKGSYGEAIDLNENALQTDPTNPVFLRFAGIAYAKAGRRLDAEKIIDRFKELGRTQYVMAYHIALIYSALGDKDKAIAELERSADEHDYLLPRIKVEPFFDPLRDDPRFDRIVKRLNFPDSRF
jgi:TolB-like protein/Flp pilus assembly protein TadD